MPDLERGRSPLRVARKLRRARPKAKCRLRNWWIPARCLSGCAALKARAGASVLLAHLLAAFQQHEGRRHPPLHQIKRAAFRLPAWWTRRRCQEWLRPAQSGALNPGAVSSQSGPASDWGRDPHEQSGFSAAALIDRNELPEWMQGQEGVQRPGAQSMEDDAEEGPQARVPRRPRLSTEPDRAPSQAAASVFSSVLGPTAGEDQRNQSSLGGRPAPLGDMSPPERSNPFGQLSAQAQAQNWSGTEMSGWNQPSGSPRGSGTLRGAEGEQGRGFDQSSAGEWPGSFGSQEPLERQRPGYRALGPLSEQRGRPAFQPDESEEMGPPPRRQAEQPGRSLAEAGFGMAGSQRPDPFAGRGAARSFNDPPSGPQGRGAPGNFGYQQEGYDGWEGGPGYDPDFAGDDEAGPPSGMFAKLKRMLGFGR